MENFDHKPIEKKWQEYWIENNIYTASDKSEKPKKYVLIEFPYPSGDGLHMGHLRPYVAGDVYSRYMRMRGFETLFPIGWDAFGLPAENYAIKKGVQPKVSTTKNIKNAKRQLMSWGTSFDWTREISTTDPDYYKWTQWIFLQFYKAGLAYEATGLINWCPKDKTGLANEEVINGVCERCGTPVEKKELRQWYLKITAYADKLLEGLKSLDQWPEAVKLQQENWIGKSEGAEIEFELAEDPKPNFLILHGRNGSPDSHTFLWLRASLEKRGYKVQSPSLPNTEEPDDEEQTNFVFKKLEINEDTIIIGHSFGGVIALRLLERGIKVKKVFLLCTPFSGKFLDKKQRLSVTKACEKGFNFKKIKQGAQGFGLLYDTRDYVVPMSDGEAFAEQLGVRLVKIAGQEPHLSGIEEPEVLSAILGGAKVFTTRPDTLFGATHLVLAPEHLLVEQITTPQQKDYVTNYVIKSKQKTELQRTALEKDKTGVFTGSYAVNPATGEKIPIWIADYVLMNYGTGAIMAVPAHDARDLEFAKKYKLPIRQVIKPEPVVKVLQNADSIASGARQEINIESDCWTGDGLLIHSGKFDGMQSLEAKKIMAKEFGKPTVQYKLRDWVFSRQRYWGEPIPLIHCEKCGVVPVPEDQLPVTLPEIEKYEPTGTGESPLAAIDSWVNVKCPSCKGPGKRETNTMPQWAGSSWYWLRYSDPRNDKELASKNLLKRWQPVDVYFGGMEHTTLHLLYSRFWNLFLYDIGVVTEKEPFVKRVPHGIILAADGEKMSKSRGNVANPDEIVKKFGADTLRMYELFLGPHEMTVSWNDQGILGVRRFLDRVWNFQENFKEGETNNNLDRLIKKITDDVEAMKFNTAIAGFMEFLNENKSFTGSDWETFLKLLSPFAPHITEELWEKLGHKKSIHSEAWPKYDPQKIKQDSVTIVVQILGRVRATFEMPIDSTQEAVKTKALLDSNVKRHLEGKQIVKEVFVKNKLINFVVK